MRCTNVEVISNIDEVYDDIKKKIFKLREPFQPPFSWVSLKQKLISMDCNKIGAHPLDSGRTPF